MTEEALQVSGVPAVKVGFIERGAGTGILFVYFKKDRWGPLYILQASSPLQAMPKVMSGVMSRTAEGERVCEGMMSKLKLDLHDIFNKGNQIEQALQDVLDQAVAKKIDEIEIIPGKGSGQLKKRVLRFLDQKHIRQMYHRIDKDSRNWGRLFVYFRH
jgi:DNA-nicking Smr family endonuclease